jgi:glycosyltransferase involved in cell wall biosynthesis
MTQATVKPCDGGDGAPARKPLRCLAIVPVFNEGGAVGKVIERLRRALPEFDVLVIDDGSTDDTLRRIASSAHVTVVSLPFNLGIGGAMQTGYRYAALEGYDIAIQVDGDGQHRPSEVRRLVNYLRDDKADLVVGSRFLEPAKYKHYRQTLFRYTGAWLLRGLLKALTGLTVTDCTSGFRAANRRVIRAFAHWYPEDYPEPEVILLLHRAGYRIGELAVKMRHRRTGQSSIGIFAGIFYVLKVTTCLLLDMVRAPWPHEKIGLPLPGDAAARDSELPAEQPDEPLVGLPQPLAEKIKVGVPYAHQESDPAPAWRQHLPAGRPATPPL